MRYLSEFVKDIFLALVVGLALLAVSCRAHAAPVGRIKADSGETLVLDDTPCKNSGHEAYLLAKDGTVMFQGCWAARGALVVIEWDDGDVTPIPARALNWRPT